MEHILEYKGWVVAVAFALLFTYELLKPAVKSGAHPARRILKNLSFWPINIGLSLLVILPVTFYATQHALWNRPDEWSGMWALALDILILDLFLYGWHRGLHKIPFLWRFHQVHHLDEHLDTSSAIRFHFGEIFFATLIRAIVVVLIAVPFSTVVIFETLVLVFTLFHHSNITLPARFEKALSKTIITPSIHWVHHHAIRKDTDSNYGTIFSIWDPIFRSKSKTQRYKKMKIGVENYNDTGFLKLLIAPFVSK